MDVASEQRIEQVAGPQAMHADDDAAPRDERHDLSFDDPYWDDAFCSWLDPTMRTCCG